MHPGCPWIMGGTLILNGDNRNVVYRIAGGCGPRVDAYLLAKEGYPK